MHIHVPDLSYPIPTTSSKTPVNAPYNPHSNASPTIAVLPEDVRTKNAISEYQSQPGPSERASRLHNRPYMVGPPKVPDLLISARLLLLVPLPIIELCLLTLFLPINELCLLARPLRSRL